MNQSNKTPASQGKKSPAAARFAVGAQVRVKPGTTDLDFPDIPLGGWAGPIPPEQPDGKATDALAKKQVGAAPRRAHGLPPDHTGRRASRRVDLGR